MALGLLQFRTSTRRFAQEPLVKGQVKGELCMGFVKAVRPLQGADNVEPNGREKDSTLMTRYVP